MNTKFAERTLADFRLRWRTALAFHLAMQVLSFAIFLPLISFIASWLVRRTGEPVVSNFDMAAFALSPLGLFFVLLIAALVMSLLIAEFAGLTWIAGHAIARRPVTLRSTIAAVLRLAPLSLILGARIFVRLLLLALPFLAILAAVWFTTLAGRDINYYLAERPPEWRRMLLIAAALGLVYFFFAQRQFVRWLCAIPILLFERTSPRAALKRSSERVKGRALRIGFPLVLWFLMITAALVALAWMGRLVTNASFDWAGISAPRVLPLVTIYVLVALLGSFLYSSVWLAGHQFMVTRLYVERLGGEAWRPPALEAELEDTQRRFAYPFLTALPFLLLLGAGAMWMIATSVNLKSDVAITAHRGASIAAPENTMAAFRAAMDAGATFIELDVQRTKDGEIVVVHDGDLMRLGDDPRKVNALSSQEIALIDVGRKYNASFTGEFPPTLKQVIDLVRGKMKINIELKYNFPDPGLAQAVIDLLRAEKFDDQVVIASLDYHALLNVESIDPRLVTGHIVTAAVGNVASTKADFLSLNAAKATVSLVRRAHAAGKGVHVWTVNTPDGMLRMIERGVDNIITDDPALLAKVIRDRNALSRSELLGLRLRVLFFLPPREVTDPDAVKTL